MPLIEQIIINFIPHKGQRYDTLGDWQFLDPDHVTDDDGPVLRISVAHAADERHQWLVALHELVEALLCRHAGVSATAIDQWDIHDCPPDLDEPGDDRRAPYYAQHQAATLHEQVFAEHLNVRWPYEWEDAPVPKPAEIA